MNLPEVPSAATPLSYRGDAWVLTRLEFWTLLMALAAAGPFWVRAKVRLRSYLWQHIFVGDTPLVWAADDVSQARMQRPISKVLLAVFAISRLALLFSVWRLIHLLCAAIAASQLELSGDLWRLTLGTWWSGNLWDSLPTLLALLVYPMYLFAANQFELHHTELRAIRFGQDGTLWGYTRLYLGGLAWTALTLGWGYAWFTVSKRRYLLEHSRYGDLRGRYTGVVAEIRPVYVWGSVAVALTLGAYLPWHVARLRNYHVSRVHLGPLQLRCHQEGSSLSNLWATNAAIALCTLFIANGWARTRSLRYQMQHLQLLGDATTLLVRPGPEQAVDGLPDLLGTATCGLFGA